MRSGKLVIAEGGGPTAVINQSLVGAVLEARLFPLSGRCSMRLIEFLSISCGPSNCHLQEIPRLHPSRKPRRSLFKGNRAA
jgi:hypothetical protein